MFEHSNIENKVDLKCQITGYQFPDSKRDDWCLLKVRVKQGEQYFEQTDPAIETTELERLAALTTVAIGPILAVVVVGVGASILLEYADNSLGITNRVIAGLDELGDSAESYLAEQKKKALNSAGQAVTEVIDQAVSSARAMAIRWVQGKIKEYLPSIPRLR